jgi:glycosyltransferase involved in cell wall biosynthesis
VAWLERTAFYRADHVIVLTPTMKEFYLDKYEISPDRLTPIPFGVDDDLFTPSLDQEPEPRITYVGNLGTFYAFEPYLRAFSRLDDEYELYIIGWGEERERLEELCSELGIDDRVTFTGRVPREQVAEYLASATLNWVPLETDYELDYARPTKLLEGMAVGTPFVGSPLAEMEVISERSNAGIITNNEPAEIAQAMEKILTNDEIRSKMEQRSVNFIEDNHRWPQLSKQMRDVLMKGG